MIHNIRIAIVLIGAFCLVPARQARAASGPSDFDFNVGTWTTRIHRTVHPFSSTLESMELQGTVTVRKLWNGGLLEEIEADGPKGHWEGLSQFLYNPKTRQWSQAFANSQNGALLPPFVGEFKDGRGELFSSDTLDGRAILVRATWSQIRPDSHRYEEHFSDDGGKTWHASFLADLTRAKANPPPAANERSREFDFEMGRWQTHTRRLLHPLTGSTEWTEWNGMTEVRPVWGGKGNLVHLETDGPTGHTEMAALRLYNPKARQWGIHFATPTDGDLGPPLIGEFKNGRGVFYDQEDFNGRIIWVRFTVYSTSSTTAHSEQAFSDDQGKTWETNIVTDYTRAEA